MEIFSDQRETESGKRNKVDWRGEGRGHPSSRWIRPVQTFAPADICRKGARALIIRCPVSTWRATAKAKLVQFLSPSGRFPDQSDASPLRTLGVRGGCNRLPQLLAMPLPLSRQINTTNPPFPSPPSSTPAILPRHEYCSFRMRVRVCNFNERLPVASIPKMTTTVRTGERKRERENASVNVLKYVKRNKENFISTDTDSSYDNIRRYGGASPYLCYHRP